MMKIDTSITAAVECSFNEIFLSAALLDVAGNLNSLDVSAVVALSGPSSPLQSLGAQCLVNIVDTC